MRQGDELSTLKQIAEGTAGSVGKDFFSSLVKTLSEILGVYGVWVTEFFEEDQKLKALAFYLNGKFIPDYEYQIRGTPCQPVVECPSRIFHIPDKVVQLFPSDKDLKKMNAVSYMGVALVDPGGKVIGHLALLDNKPMPDRPRIMSIFRIFASRAAAELQRLHTEKRMMQSEEKLFRLVNGTHDCMIEMNENLVITQANRAGIELFELPPEINNIRIDKILTPEGLKKFSHALLFIKEKSLPAPYYWIQGYLLCQSLSGKDFPAEATITEYRHQDKNYFTLILRNVQNKLEAEKTISSLHMETRLLREEVKKIYHMEEILGESPGIIKALNAVRQVSSTPTTVLLLGETGTGKEVFAKAIHYSGDRKQNSMVRVNCAALPASLIESELFGHEKGAFTGATNKRDGRFMLADKSTIFLDEIGEMPLELQAKLLRVIQEGEFEPVGSSKPIKVDTRIIAATNRNLVEEVKKGRFREDLYYRLNVFPIHIPPLRERDRDVVILAGFFLEKFAGQYKKGPFKISAMQEQQLLQYSWPGNIRELQNVVERAVITSEEGRLNFQVEPGERKAMQPVSQMVIPQPEWKEMEKQNILRALKLAQGKVSGPDGAAAMLQLPATTLASRMKALGIGRAKAIGE